MCIYSRKVFSCQHETWGRRIRFCTDGEDYAKGETTLRCQVRTQHDKYMTVLFQACKSCSELEGKLSAARMKLAGCKEDFEKKWSTTAIPPALLAGAGDDGHGESDEKWLSSIDASIAATGNPSAAALVAAMKKLAQQAQIDWKGFPDFLDGGGVEDEGESRSPSPPRLSSADEEDSVCYSSDTSAFPGSQETKHFLTGRVQESVETEASLDEHISNGSSDEVVQAEEAPAMKGPAPKRTIPRSRLARPASRLPRAPASEPSAPPSKTVSKLPQPRTYNTSKLARPGAKPT